MDLQYFNIFIPYEVGDIIKADDDNKPNQYEILDIQFTYSAKQRKYVKIDLILLDLTIKREVKLPYDYCIWRMVKQNNE